MRASLASATSLLALLLLEGHAAHATPSITTGTTVGFTDAFGHDDMDSLSVTPPDDTRTKFRSEAPIAGMFDQTSVADFDSITPTPSSRSGPYTFTPVTTPERGPGTIAITTTGANGSTQALTLTGGDVSPLETISTSKENVLTGQFAPINLVQNKTGNGNLAGSWVSARGHGDAGNSVFIGTSGAQSLMEGSAAAPSAAASSTFGYSVSPVAPEVRSTAAWTPIRTSPSPSATGGSAPMTSGTTAASPQRFAGSGLPGSGAGSSSFGGTRSGDSFVARGATFNPNGGANKSGSGFAGRGNTGGASSTLGYTYTPVSRGTGSPVVQAAFNGYGNAASDNTLPRSVMANAPTGPIFASSIVGSGVSDTPVAVPHGVVGPPTSVIDFGTIAYGSSNTLYLALSNLATDLNGADNLTIEGYTIAGADASSFSVASLTAGTVIAEGGTLVVPITVVGTRVGELSSNLTIFTNEGAGLGGTGATFTYFLDPNSLVVSSPEPASIAVLGAGLAGLASIRRRRRQGATASCSSAGGQPAAI